MSSRGARMSSFREVMTVDAVGLSWWVPPLRVSNMIKRPSLFPSEYSYISYSLLSLSLSGFAATVIPLSKAMREVSIRKM